jgi:hypothetical protein
MSVCAVKRIKVLSIKHGEPIDACVGARGGGCRSRKKCGETLGLALFFLLLFLLLIIIIINKTSLSLSPPPLMTERERERLVGVATEEVLKEDVVLGDDILW